MNTAQKLTAIAENVSLVFAAGEQSEHDRFWDTYQNNGARRDYGRAFSGKHWNKNNFKPKYPIICEATNASASSTFSNFNCDTALPMGEVYFDMTGIEMDFSLATEAGSTFANARVKNLFCDFRNATSMYLTFASTNNGNIENLTVRVSAKCTNYNLTFGYQRFMTTLIFTNDSVIAAKISFEWLSRLSHDSIVSIINALSTTTSGLSVTLSKTAVTNAFGSVDSTEWTNLVATKPNWTISLT